MKLIKKYGIWIGLLVVALASVWVAGLDDDTSTDKAASANKSKPASGKNTKGQAAPTRHDPSEALALIHAGFAPRGAMSKLKRDPFATVSFEPPPPPAPPPPAPKAPPLRFKYLGTLRDGEEPQGAEKKERTVFLDNGGEMLIAHKGDTLAGQYRVLEINETNMQLEYTPLAERQTLNFGR